MWLQQQVEKHPQSEYGAGIHHQKNGYSYVLPHIRITRKVWDMSTPPKELVAHLGQLVRAERARLGYTSVEKAAEAAGIGNFKTLAQFELGHTFPQSTNRSKIEDLLMWRDGSLTEALKKDQEELTFDWFRDWEKEEPASAASELTDEALLLEVIKRMDRWRMALGPVAEVVQLQATVHEGKSAAYEKRTPAQSNHEAYDLAAHTPRGGKKIDPRKATRK